MTTSFPIQQVTAELAEQRRRWREAHQRSAEAGGREFPSRDALARAVTQLKGVLFPMRLGPHDLLQESENFYVAHALDTALHQLQAQIALELRYTHRAQPGLDERAFELTRQFALALPEIRRLLDTDVQAAYEGDPAARTVDEVLLCYPGVLALIHHRIAHQLYRSELPLLARIVAELAHSETGIDIHPGAQIGEGFFIDHGTGAAGVAIHSGAARRSAVAALHRPGHTNAANPAGLAAKRGLGGDRRLSTQALPANNFRFPFCLSPPEFL